MSDDVSIVHVAGLGHVPPTWIPEVGEIFEARLRGHGDRWCRLRWLGWSKVDPGQALVEGSGPRPYDVVVGTRPVAP